MFKVPQINKFSFSSAQKRELFTLSNVGGRNRCLAGMLDRLNKKILKVELIEDT